MAAISPDLTQSCQRRSAKGLANAINFHFDFLVRKCILGFCCCCNISHFHSRFRNACGSHTLTHSERARSCILNHIWYLHTKCICAQRSTTINIVNTYTYAFFSIFFSVFFFFLRWRCRILCMLHVIPSSLFSAFGLSFIVRWSGVSFYYYSIYYSIVVAYVAHEICFCCCCCVCCPDCKNIFDGQLLHTET